MREMRHALATLGRDGRTDETTTYGNVDLPYEISGDELIDKAGTALESFADSHAYTIERQGRRERYLPDEQRQIQDSTRMEARSTRGLRRKVLPRSREGFFIDIDHERDYETLGIDTIGGEVPESDIDAFVEELYTEF